MIKTEKFLISRSPYAVDLKSLRLWRERWVVDAVWFRRRNGRTAACIGTLQGSFHTQPPVSAEDFLARWPAQWGGDCAGRWNGVGYWGSELPDVQEAHLRILKPMLEGYPAAPAGYDAWWQRRAR